jgi:hypothetical protein
MKRERDDRGGSVHDRMLDQALRERRLRSAAPVSRVDAGDLARRAVRDAFAAQKPPQKKTS